MRARAGRLAAAALVVASLLASPRVRARDEGAPGPGDHPTAVPDPDEDLPPPPRGPPLPTPEWPRPPPDPATAVGRDEAREASGTSWQPLGTPHRAAHLALGPGELMLHGSAFLAWSDQGGPRGTTELFGESWLMAMARAPLAGGSVALRAMASLDPLTMRGSGYPELLQTGESSRGAPLHDRQHPHDLWMELAAIARAPLGEGLAVEAYGGPVGEPALGPVAFPHRASALHDPAAPLSHHWIDSTHISQGVVTGALAARDAKIEASWFNGREPDEHRGDLDAPRLDSWSARLTLSPLRELVVQGSYGRLASPEPLAPGQVHRATASALWNERLGRTGDYAVLAAWGRNVEAGHRDDALLLEGTWDHTGQDAIFGRLEWVRKSARELVLAGFAPERRFDVLALAVGYAHTFPALFGVEPAAGARVAVHGLPAELGGAYGRGSGLGVGSSPVGLFFFVQLLPAVNDAVHAAHAAHGGDRARGQAEEEPPPHGGHAGHEP